MKRLVVACDHLLGLRAWGLVLYGVLPVNLAYLGLVRIPQTDDFKLALVALSLPLFVTFLLVVDRHRTWYLTRDWLILRSTVVCLAIVALSVLNCVALGLIKNPGLEWAELVPSAFLTAGASLVLSSTLFMTLLTKRATLPGIPPGKLLEQMAALRADLVRICGARVLDDARAEDLQATLSTADSAQEKLKSLESLSSHRLVRWSLDPVAHQLEALKTGLQRLANSKSNELREGYWDEYFRPAVCRSLWQNVGAAIRAGLSGEKHPADRKTPEIVAICGLIAALRRQRFRMHYG